VDPPVHPELRPTRTGQSLTTQPPRPDRTTDVEHPDSQVRTTATPSSRSRGPKRNQLTPPRTSVDRGLGLTRATLLRFQLSTCAFVLVRSLRTWRA
jgi:hypothetical protein